MKNKDIQKQIEDVLSLDPVVKEYQKKKEEGSLTYFDKIQHAKYLAMKTSQLYSVFHN